MSIKVRENFPARGTLKVSVCVCTRNREKDLKRCLGSLFYNASDVDEVIVSDDSSSDATQKMVMADFPNAIYLSGPRKGLGANRNLALREVSGDVVLFLDDDAVLAPDFFHFAFKFASDNDIDLLRFILTGTEINQGQIIRSQDQDFLGFQKRAYSIGDEINTLVINSSVIPSWLAKKVGFDEVLVYGSDEVDFAIRARREGIKIVFCPDLKNLHFPSAVNREYYSPFTDASRIYVTFKRYFMLEKNYSKSLLFIFVASAHLLAAHVKRFGFKGVSRAAGSLRKAYTYIFLFLIRPDDATKRSGS